MWINFGVKSKYKQLWNSFLNKKKGLESEQITSVAFANDTFWMEVSLKNNLYS